MIVRAHAAIWIDDLLAVHSERVRGELRVTLPGGRVGEREAVTDALRREVQEELGIDIEVGSLLLCAEVVSATSHHELELVFSASVDDDADTGHIELIDPSDPGAQVLPPVLPQLAHVRDGLEPDVWLGNLFSGALREA